MKQQTTKLSGSLNYLAGISSPTAANLSVQGLTDGTGASTPKRSSRRHTKRSSLSTAFLAGLSSPSAANLSAQGVSAKDALHVRF